MFKFVLRSSLKGSHKKYDETKYGRFCVLCFEEMYWPEFLKIVYGDLSESQ